MFSIFKRSKLASPDLMYSRLFDEHSFYSAFIRDLKSAKKEVIIESPYITCRRVNQLLPVLGKLVKNKVKVTINTRNPQHHDTNLRFQAYMAFKKFRLVGIKVRTFNDYHHRKIAVIDGRILYEGSLNILSQGRSREIMRRIESEELTKQMIGFLKLHRMFW